MQDAYVGDIGDYVKYALLRALGRDKKLGVAWYLHRDEENGDGEYIDYLEKPELWSNLDPPVFYSLQSVIRRSKLGTGRRSVREVQSRNLLGHVIFSRQLLYTELPSSAWQKRRTWRKSWFRQVTDKLSNCDIVFADPDNGLAEDGSNGTKRTWTGSREKDLKLLALSEALALMKKPNEQKRTAIFIHHNGRTQKHVDEITKWLKLLSEDSRDTYALYWRGQGYSNYRTFFVVDPAPSCAIANTMETFAKKWLLLGFGKLYQRTPTGKITVSMYGDDENTVQLSPSLWRTIQWTAKEGV